MTNFNYINEKNIAIKTSYDKTPAAFNENTRPDTKAIQVAKDSLSPVAFSIYNTICSLRNGAFAVTSVEALAKQLNITAEQFNIALEELIANRYLNYNSIVRNGVTYVGNTFQFIPDNSLVAVIPEHTIARTDEEYARLLEAWKKPYYFIGSSDAKEEF